MCEYEGLMKSVLIKQSWGKCFKIAKENKLIVLPILIKSNLQNDFNSYVGHYHFIDKNNSTYNQQLKEFFDLD